MQNHFEILKKNKLFARFYTPRENTGKTFDILYTASILQSRTRSDQDWLMNYQNVILLDEKLFDSMICTNLPSS